MMERSHFRCKLAVLYHPVYTHADIMSEIGDMAMWVNTE